MYPLPIVERELRLRARWRSTYWLRTLAGVGASTVALFALTVFSFFWGAGQVGKVVFRGLCWSAFVFCLVEGTRQTADLISEEKREGTLGLLFLTDLNGVDIVLGKLAAAGVSLFCLLLTFVPALALTMLSGGVTAGELSRLSLTLLNGLFCALAAGLWVSARTADSQKSLVGAQGAMLAWTILPWIVGTIEPVVLRFSPAYGLQAAWDVSYQALRGAYWGSLAITQAIAWVLLAWAACRVTRFRVSHETHGKPTPAPSLTETHAFKESSKLASWLEVNPVAWLALKGTEKRWVRDAFLLVLAGQGADLLMTFARTGVGALTSPLRLGSFATMGFLLAQLLAATTVSNRMVQARRNGGIELLLSTPLSNEEIVRGQWLAWKRMAVWPILAYILISMGLVALLLFVSQGLPRSADHSLGIWLVCAGNLVVLTSDLLALGWVGMWYGLRARKAVHAAGKTFLVVMLLPSMVLSCSVVPLPPFVVWGAGSALGSLPVVLVPTVLTLLKNLAFISWARNSLRLNFRRAAFHPPGTPFRPSLR